MSKPIENKTQSVVYSVGCSPINGPIIGQMNDTSNEPIYYEMSNCETLSPNVLPSIPLPYFDAFYQDFNYQSVHTIDWLASIDRNIFECNTKTMEAIKRANEMFENYLKISENKNSVQLKNIEKTIGEKFDSMATDFKNTTQRLQTIEELIQNSYSKIDSNTKQIINKSEAIEEYLKTNVSSMLTDLNVRNNSMPSKSISYQMPFRYSKYKNQDLHQINSICEPIANKLSEVLSSVMNNCFDDFKKTIIDQKIVEVIGDQIDETCNHSDDSTEIDLWLLRNGRTDKETLRSKVLDLLNDSKITESFKIALSLFDSEFVSHLCSAFQNCPQKLLTELNKSKDSQKLLVSLLDQLFDSGVIVMEKRWKIPLIAGLILRIDMRSPISKASVPSLADHWSAIMERVAQMGGPHSEKARLLAISLKHISTEFY